MSETFVFTPILHGAHNSTDPQPGVLRCSVHVGIHLSPPNAGLAAVSSGTAAQFPLFAAWPQSIPSFKIVLEDGTQLPAQFVNPPSAADISAMEELWAAYFPRVTPVRQPVAVPLPPEGTDRWFDVSTLAPQIQAHYTMAGKQLTRPPTPILLHPEPIRIHPEPVLAAKQAVPEEAFILTSPNVAQQAKQFFQNPSPGLIPNPGPPPPPDVHDLLAYLHQTPAVLRALGLILEIEANWPNGVLPASSSITLLPTFPGLKPDVTMTPTLAFTAAATGLESGYEPVGGLWVAPFDPMHAAHVFSQAADGPTAALRSTGISVMRVPAKDAAGNATSANMARIRTRVAQFANALTKPITLTPADLVAGHRIDVWDGTAWRSLCQVQGTASRNGSKPITIDSEGMISSSVAVDPDGAVRANDTLACWNGWSLCAQRPGTHVSQNAAIAPLSSAQTGIQTSKTLVPGTLPTLRFGRQYRFRARLVDVAGNSLPAPAPMRSVTGVSNPVRPVADMTAATEPVTFLRCEPVGSPPTAFASTPGPGESSTQLVVRTYAAGSTAATASACVRYILPPETSVEMAEKHGALDTATGALDPQAYGRIQQQIQKTGNTLWNSTQPQPSTTFPKKADVFQAQIYANGAPPVPYLPDPACDGAVLIAIENGAAIGLANGASVAVKFVTGTNYPANYTAGSIGLNAGSAAAATGNGNSFDLTLPPGERVTVGLASTVSQSAASLLAIPGWVTGTLDAADHAAYLANVQSGLMSAVTPARELKLIHAVQQPLAAPAISNPAVTQAAGDLAATFSGSVTVDAKTTATVTVEASWSEWVDGGPGTAVPGLKSMTAHLATLSVSSLGAQPLALNNQYVFGDTKCRNPLTLDAIAASSFAEFFPSGLDCTVRSSAPLTTCRPATQQPAAPRLAYAIPTFKWSRSVPSLAQGYVSTRLGNALRIYLDRPFYTSGNGELLAVVVSTQPATSDGQLQPSLWGADPLAASAPPPLPNICDFLLETEDNFAGKTSWPAGSATTLKFYEVEYDAVTDRYFCDIAFDATQFGSAYRPFVQLQIAAYQPNAVAGCQLSSTVTVPFTQIFPDRTLTVALQPASDNSPMVVTAALTGTGPETPSSVFTSGLGRGIGSKVDVHFDFAGVVNPKSKVKVPPGLTPGGNPGTGSTGPAGSGKKTTKMAQYTTLADGQSVWIPIPNLGSGSYELPNYPPGVGVGMEGDLGDPIATTLGNGVNFVSVHVTVYEWETLSPTSQLLEPLGNNLYFLDEFEARPWRMVYVDEVEIATGYVEPVDFLPVKSK